MTILSSRWIPFLLFSLLSCSGVQVMVRDEKKFAMLFSSVVLPCQYSTHSKQTPVVQWWYSSYCTDRTHDSFTFPETLGMKGSELGATAHLDCPDSSRTVRIVASRQGSSFTLAEHYKTRDISIINNAELRIGELQWGDSGIYSCKVIIGDDVDGETEGQLELLVLGKTGVLDDVLPEFELEIMPEWVFVGCVVLAGLLFLLFIGVCWCQCCPHSCCCYVRCCCCPDTCCCPKHLYEAGKQANSGQPTQIAMYSPYYIPGVPIVPRAVPPIAEPTISAAPPPMESNMTGVRSGYRLQASQGQDVMKVVYYIERDLAQFRTAKGASHPSRSLSELSSLHEADVDFRQTYRQVQKKALQPIGDHEAESHICTAPTGPGLRSARYQSTRDEEQVSSRWNPRSEHLHRKAFDGRGRTGSLDELEEFARSYGPRAGRRVDPRGPQRDFEMELRPQDPRSTYRDRPHRFHDAADEWYQRSPPPSPRRRRDTGASERYAARSLSYDDTYLTSLLERKTRERGERGGWADEDSDTPSKDSSKNSRSASYRPEEDDPLPPYCEAERYRAEKGTERERYRTLENAAQPFSYTRPSHGTSRTLKERREDKEKPRKLTSHLSRESLIV
ncbi:immunoglobulin-like domain-containing receptor 2 isoform X1 [Electrophorus electricus]|uniref:immunoglobulin-like domain-containing receptor 2 isoform X1 n=1 Tax=Electrophorus electricus TaxID=8005 RepID=UPI0015CFE317|nr:immunoglobulin-like domain-containing receptor 2 isoform X1 [Electrophorus electricus]